MSSILTQKRLAGEIRLLKKSPIDLADTFPDEKNMLLWYFLVKGPDGTDYEGGYYIGKIVHDPEYPIKPPEFYMLTPNGRFEIEKKICLTNSSYHKELWNSSWNMSSMIVGFLSVMATDDTSGISHIKMSSKERKILARESIPYNIQHYYDIWIKFERYVKPDGSVKTKEELESIKTNQNNNKNEMLEKIQQNIKITENENKEKKEKEELELKKKLEEEERLRIINKPKYNIHGELIDDEGNTISEKTEKTDINESSINNNNELDQNISLTTTKKVVRSRQIKKKTDNNKNNDNQNNDDKNNNNDNDNDKNNDVNNINTEVKKKRTYVRKNKVNNNNDEKNNDNNNIVDADMNLKKEEPKKTVRTVRKKKIDEKKIDE